MRVVKQAAAAAHARLIPSVSQDHASVADEAVLEAVRVAVSDAVAEGGEAALRKRLSLDGGRCFFLSRFMRA